MAVRSLPLALALALVSPVAFAGITGVVQGCSTSNSSACNEVIALNLRPEAAIASTDSALFVGIFPASNGQPQISTGGYFTRSGWKVSSEPLPVLIGRLRAQTARIPIPGGVCGLAKSNNAPAGDYVLLAGWGRANMGMEAGSGLDVAGLLEEARTADPETRAQMLRLIEDYRNAQRRMQIPGGREAMAFTDMRTNRTYWPIKTYNCR